MFGTKTSTPLQSSLFGRTNSNFGSGGFTSNSTPPVPSQNMGFGIVQNEQSEYIKNQQEILKNISDLKDALKKEPEKIIYVACKHHNHLLREVCINDIANNTNYQYGFNCDVCKSRQSNISERFFHCDDCAKEQRYFDICIKCVKSCLQ